VTLRLSEPTNYYYYFITLQPKLGKPEARAEPMCLMQESREEYDNMRENICHERPALKWSASHRHLDSQLFPYDVMITAVKVDEEESMLKGCE
jgi:hypothetical protein